MNAPPQENAASEQARRVWWRWLLVIAVATAIIAIGAPEGITDKSWWLFAIFIATILGSILRPAPAGAVVLFGVCAIAVTRTMTPAEALKGYSDPLVWLVLCAFMISRGVMKTGLGERIAYLFIRAIGRRSIGLAYALVGTDTILASILPSNSARAGGVIFPIARSLGARVRLQSRPHRAPARRVPHAGHLPVRRDRLRDVPHRAGVERADRTLRA